MRILEKPKWLVFVVILTLLSSFALVVQADEKVVFPVRRPTVDPIWVGEKQELSVSFLGFKSLHVEIEVLPHEIVNGRKSSHAEGRVRLAGLASAFYSLNDRVETWFDSEGLFSHRWHLVQDETKIKRDSWENHDHVKGETVFRNQSQKKDSALETTQLVAPFQRFAQDSFSALYFLRSLPLAVEDSYRIPVVSEGNTIEVLARVQGVDLIDVLGEKMQALQIRLEKLDSQGKPIANQNNLVWLSNDERRFLLRVDVGTRFGHLIAVVKKLERGQKDVPLSSQSASLFPSPRKD